MKKARSVFVGHFALVEFLCQEFIDLELSPRQNQVKTFGSYQGPILTKQTFEQGFPYPMIN